MDAFLQAAYSEGEHDSHGVFTINVEKAEVKLAEFQLAAASQIPMFLLAAGTQAGADCFRVSFPEKSKTVIRYEGWELTAEDLRCIGMESLKAGTPLSLKYLGVAFSTLGAHHNFILRSGDLSVAFQHSVIRFLEERQEGSGLDCLEIEIDCGLRRAFEKGLIGQQKFCPFPVIIGNKELRGGYDPSSESIESFAYLCRRGPGLSEVSLKYTNNVLLELPETDGGSPMALSFTHPREGEFLGFWLLINGLACKAPAEFAPRGFFGVAVADRLEVSLSYEVVQNAAYQSFREEVLSACGALVQRAQSELTRSQDRSRRHMLDDASRELIREQTRSRANRSNHTQATEPGGLFGRPETDLLEKLGDLSGMSEGEIATLFEQLSKRVWQLFQHGRLPEALNHEDALLKAKNARGLYTWRDHLVRTLMAFCANPGELPSRESLELYLDSDLAGVAGYLLLLMDWVQQGSVSLPASPREHPTWLAPITVRAFSGSAAWHILYDHLREERISEALGLLKSDSTLEFEGNKSAWLQYFWTYHRGRLSWTQSVKLRVALSFSIEDHSPDFQSMELEQACREVLLREISRAPFWPHFFTLLKRTGDSEKEPARRMCWTSLFVRALAGAYLHDLNGSPLEYPLSLVR